MIIIINSQTILPVISQWSHIISDTGWAECQDGYMISGFLKNGTNSCATGFLLYCLNFYYCSIPIGVIGNKNCVDIPINFTTQGWYECPNGTFLHGINRKAPGEGIQDIIGFRCCEFIHNTRQLEQDSIIYEYTQISTCLDENANDAICNNIELNSMIIGIYKTGDAITCDNMACIDNVRSKKIKTIATEIPTKYPTKNPTIEPTLYPTQYPTKIPMTQIPTNIPTQIPTILPTFLTTNIITMQQTELKKILSMSTNLLLAAVIILIIIVILCGLLVFYGYLYHKKTVISLQSTIDTLTMNKKVELIKLNKIESKSIVENDGYQTPGNEITSNIGSEGNDIKTGNREDSTEEMYNNNTINMETAIPTMKDDNNV